MFKRNVTVTNSHQMSGKDVKKLVKQVALIFPSLSEKEVKQIIPNKTEVLVTKLSNRCFAYSVAGNPVFFEHEDVIYPSVYTLWAYPDMLPTLYTHSEVSPKIVGGADLMLPGVIVPEAGLGDFQVRDHSAISIPENPFPFAVGYIETDSESIKENGLKGRGIKLLHHYPDALWSLGSKKVPNAGFKPNRIFPVEDPKAAAAASKVSDELETLEVSSKDRDGDGDAKNTPQADGANIDELIDSTFLRALCEKLTDKELPMDSSKFYSNCMLPSRPQGTDIDIKKSSYKKLSKLIKKMEKRGLITVKQSKKEDRITTVNREHEVYKSFQQELAKEGPATATANDATATATQKKATRLQGKHIEVFEMFKPVSNLRPVFGEAAVANKDALFSREEVKTALMRYTQQQALSAEGSRDALKLDKLLKSGLYGKKEPVEVGTLVKIRDVFDRLMTKMQLYHKVVCEEADGAQEEVIRKGKIKNIHVLAEDRHAGRKFITRVTHLESFAIDPQEFAGNLQRTFKCSSTVQKLPGKNETGREVSLQGNLLHEICNYLECQCGIHPKFIEKTSKMR